MSKLSFDFSEFLSQSFFNFGFARWYNFGSLWCFNVFLSHSEWWLWISRLFQIIFFYDVTYILMAWLSSKLEYWAWSLALLIESLFLFFRWFFFFSHCFRFLAQLFYVGFTINHCLLSFVISTSHLFDLDSRLIAMLTISGHSWNSESIL